MKQFCRKQFVCLFPAFLIILFVFFEKSHADDWVWQNPLPTGEEIRAVWGASSSDVFAVGGYGTIFHYDGSSWSSMDTGTYTHFTDVWGSSGSDVFAIGDNGAIYHYDGSSWSSMTAGVSNNLYGIWGSSGSDVFVVGYGTAILHYDGSSWSQQSTPLPYISYIGIWGTSGTDVYAVGTSGTIIHYDGSTWSTMVSGTTIGLSAVWGTSGTDIFAAGYSGTILHYDGASWSSMTSGTTQSLNSIWGSGSSDVYAVGSNGTTIHYNGSSWAAIDPGAATSFNGVWGTSASDVFIVGYYGTICHYSGSAWSAMSSGSLTYVQDIWVNNNTDAFTAGYSGTIMRYDGSTWSAMTSGTTEGLYGIWGSSGSDVFAVGASGTILYFDGSSWSAMTSNTTANFMAVWGTDEENVYAVGSTGTIFHYDGSSWSAMTSGTTQHLIAVWGSHSSDIFAVGFGGTILHYDGSTWSTMTSGTTTNLRGVWGRMGADVFAVGESGTILHYDGASWSSHSSGTSQHILDVWGRTGSHVFAVGYNRIVLLYGGASWSQMDTTGIQVAYGIAGFEDHVFAVGQSGAIRYYNDPFIPPPISCYEDLDQDVFGSTITVLAADGTCDTAENESYLNTDCNDSDANSYPGAVEVVGDGVDQNCNGEEICYADMDDDGYRPDSSSTVTSSDLDCADSSEAIGTDPTGDCDDTDGAIYPGAIETIADGIDQDCNGLDRCYQDNDGDTYGSSATLDDDGNMVCTDSGESSNNMDCDDTAAAINPGAVEISGDGIDQDCNGEEICYADMDDDGYRPDVSSTVTSSDADCSDSSEAIGTDPTGDCDDTDGAIYPGAIEIIGDGIDQDCNGLDRCFQDSDNDTYGSSATLDDDGNMVCTDPGESVNSSDCDDTDGSINPAAIEICDAIDNNCSGFIDEDNVCGGSCWLLFLPAIITNVQK